MGGKTSRRTAASFSASGSCLSTSFEKSFSGFKAASDMMEDRDSDRIDRRESSLRCLRVVWKYGWIAVERWLNGWECRGALDGA